MEGTDQEEGVSQENVDEDQAIACATEVEELEARDQGDDNAEEVSLSTHGGGVFVEVGLTQQTCSLRMPAGQQQEHFLVRSTSSSRTSQR